MNKVGKTFAAGSLLAYMVSETVQDIQHPGDIDRDRTNVYLTDTGYVSWIPETIVQEAAYQRPVPEKAGVTQRRVGDTGAATATG